MNVVEKAGKKTGSDLRPNAVDFDRFRLRRFIESLGARRTRHPQRAGRSRRHRRGDGGQPEGGAVSRRRSREGGTRRQRHGRPLADRGGVRRQAGRADEGSAAAASQQAGDLRGVARRGALPGGGADRRRRRRDQAAGASAARRRRRALYLGLDRLCHRSEDRLHQRRPAPADAALRTRDRHRSRRAERSAGDLPGQRRGGKAHAGELRASARIRSIMSPA